MLPLPCHASEAGLLGGDHFRAVASLASSIRSRIITLLTEASAADHKKRRHFRKMSRQAQEMACGDSSERSQSAYVRQFRLRHRTAAGNRCGPASVAWVAVKNGLSRPACGQIRNDTTFGGDVMPSPWSNRNAGVGFYPLVDQRIARAAVMRLDDVAVRARSSVKFEIRVPMLTKQIGGFQVPRDGAPASAA